MNQLKIRHFREQKNVTQPGLAEMTGVSQGEISAYESGHKSPRVNTLIAIADALGVTLLDILGDLVKQ
jgi:transcriptional regulator with XRE-family HTH domain